MAPSMLTRLKDSRAAKKAYRRALSAFEAGEFEQAIQQIEEHRRLAEKNPMACQILGRALFETGRIEESVPWLKKAGDLAPHNPAHHLYLAYAWYSLDNLKNTEEALDEAVKADPENPMGFYLRGLCLLRRGRIKEAETVFEKFVGFEKGTVFIRLLAMAELYLRQETSSVKEADDLIEQVEKHLDDPANRPGQPLRLMENMLGLRIGYPDAVLARLLAMAEHYFNQIEKAKTSEKENDNS
ncbi:MAG: tetratricopeptide repeat protein [bacterium]|nr:tetratricopeptide repeat protein [bacterium]